MTRSVVLDLGDYPGGLRISHADMTLSAPASAMLKDVKAAALAEGLFYPPDPNSWDQCSFGGSLATNAGGPCACKYGMTRHWVLSVDALMDDGEVHTFGIPTVKNNAGPNLAQVLVGSEGIFGVILGATVRVIPRPAQLLTLLLPVDDWHALLDVPAALVGAGYLPSAFEFWDPRRAAGDARPWPGRGQAHARRSHGPAGVRRSRLPRGCVPGGDPGRAGGPGRAPPERHGCPPARGPLGRAAHDLRGAQGAVPQEGERGHRGAPVPGPGFLRRGRRTASGGLRAPGGRQPPCELPGGGGDGSSRAGRTGLRAVPALHPAGGGPSRASTASAWPSGTPSWP